MHKSHHGILLILGCLLMAGCSPRVYDIGSSPAPVRPAPLRPGDTVAIFSISNHVDEDAIAAGVDTLKAWGLNVRFAGNLFKRNGRYDGTMQERTASTQELMDDPSVKAMISTRGGYGSFQIIPGLDFRKMLRHPKWVVGYSDVTGLHITLNNLGIESIHGTMANDLGDPQSSATLHEALFGSPRNIVIPSNENCRKGEASGRLVGGNLSLIYDAQGTPYGLNMKDAILLVEDVGEANYRIDRMLRNLERSGKLDEIRGLVVGYMTDMKNDDDIDISIPEIIKEVLEGRDIPVMWGAPIGHEDPNHAVCLGRNVRLKVDSSSASLIFE